VGKDEALHRFIPGDHYLHARAKVIYHWRKARWHALNALGFIPSCLPTSFDLAPLALVAGRKATMTNPQLSRVSPPWVLFFLSLVFCVVGSQIFCLLLFFSVVDELV